MNPVIMSALGVGFKIAGAEIGKRVGAHVLPSVAAPAARAFVGWGFGSKLGYLGAVAANVSKEEAGFYAFKFAKEVAPAVGASVGGMAGTMLFSGAILARGYVVDYAYKLYEERNIRQEYIDLAKTHSKINKQEEFNYSQEEADGFIVVNKARM